MHIGTIVILCTVSRPLLIDGHQVVTWPASIVHEKISVQKVLATFSWFKASLWSWIPTPPTALL